MKKALLTLIALSLSTAAFAKEKDNRHWRDRINDISNYRDRLDDGSRRVRTNFNLFDTPTRLRSENECKFVERIDKQGERHYDFICP